MCAGVTNEGDGGSAGMSLFVVGMNAESARHPPAQGGGWLRRAERYSAEGHRRQTCHETVTLDT